MTVSKRKPRTSALRTEVFALRLDPKLKYLAEIAARKQRRSLANYVEWAIERTFDTVRLNGVDGPTLSEASSRLWALDESDRLINLIKYYPDLMTYEEQLIWRTIREYSVYKTETEEFINFIMENEIAYSLIRDCWPQLKAYALGAGTREELDSVVCKHDAILYG
ncbi:MAG TPA: hypothetical protein PKJ85_08955 [Nitrosomonas nitrosa]|nr:hypothetical protein [Nitrosomonas nitrosa]